MIAAISAAGIASGRPIFTRGYATVTALVTPDDPEALGAWFAALGEGVGRYGREEPRVVPEGATPLVGFDLTAHRGHFMGSGHSRLVLYTHGRPVAAHPHRVYARRPRLGAGGGYLRPDAVASRSRLPPRRPARPSTRPGARAAWSG